MCVGIAIFFLWILVFPITDWWVRFISRKAINKESGTGGKVCLTFDDGPDQRYTPEVLNILKKYKVPALFFLVGAKAERFPDLVKRIEAEGHQIGSHTYFHRHAYLLSPWKSLKTITKGVQALEAIIKKPIVWFRPPWGVLNFFQYLWVRRLGLRIVLWNSSARDWLKKTGASGIMKLLLPKVKPNSIILLHDAGGEPGAPANTIAALPGIIEKLRAAGYTFVTPEEILREGSNHAKRRVS